MARLSVFCLTQHQGDIELSTKRFTAGAFWLSGVATSSVSHNQRRTRLVLLWGFRASAAKQRKKHEESRRDLTPAARLREEPGFRSSREQSEKARRGIGAEAS